MPKQPSLLHRLLVPLATLVLGGALPGCSDVDWNWDNTWWQQPRRVVKPTPARAKPATEKAAEAPAGREAKPAGQASEDTRGKEPEQASPEPAAPPVAKAAPAAGAKAAPPDARGHSGARSSPESAAPPDIRPAPQPERRALPFYQLYLVSAAAEQAAAEPSTRPADGAAGDGAGDEETTAGGHRGEFVLKLERAAPWPCASLLEMLYVPVGRSGSLAECYLLYGNFTEFERAAGFAATLDVRSEPGAEAPIGAGGAFTTGVAQFLRVVDQGAAVPRSAIDSCERLLAQALQSFDLPPQQRWAAGILAGRLVSDFRYDYASARSYYRQAERVASPQSLENMTARWWQADSFLQEGKVEDGNEIYKSLLADFGEKSKDSQIIHRCQAALKKSRK